MKWTGFCCEARQTDELIDPASESPVIYRQPYWRNGSEKRVKECFAVAAGCGNNDHIFNPKIKLSIQQHIAQGHKILLNLNQTASFFTLAFQSRRCC